MGNVAIPVFIYIIQKLQSCILKISINLQASNVINGAVPIYNSLGSWPIILKL